MYVLLSHSCEYWGTLGLLVCPFFASVEARRYTVRSLPKPPKASQSLPNLERVFAQESAARSERGGRAWNRRVEVSKNAPLEFFVRCPKVAVVIVLTFLLIF